MKLFISYSHIDETTKSELDKFLVMLKRNGVLETWDDRKIEPGDEWDQAINQNLINSDIILLLVSQDFLASDYCYDVEVKKALQFHNNNEKTIIPIIVHNCDWKGSPLAKLQALPKDGVPIFSKKWNSKEDAIMNVVQGIKKVVSNHKLGKKGINIYSTNKQTDNIDIKVRSVKGKAIAINISNNIKEKNLILQSKLTNVVILDSDTDEIIYSQRNIIGYGIKEYPFSVRLNNKTHRFILKTGFNPLTGAFENALLINNLIETKLCD